MTDPLVKACDLYPRTSRGPGERTYLVGYLGGLKVLIFRNHNPAEDGPTHSLFHHRAAAAAGQAAKDRRRSCRPRPRLRRPRWGRLPS